jgi:hypothetical protein
MTSAEPRIYRDLAEWWPLLSPPAHYVEEAADLLNRLGPLPDSPRPTLLELGAGGGSLAFHLKRHFHMTLTDRSPQMQAVSRKVNPECEHILGDMQSLRLDRRFDFVLIHDAIMYATEPAAVQATLATAAIHCRIGGTVIVLPDFVRETFTRAPTMAARTVRTAAAFAISTGPGIRIRPTTPIWWTTRSCCARPTGVSRWSTIGTRKVCFLGHAGSSGSARPACRRGHRWISGGATCSSRPEADLDRLPA